MRHTTSGAVGGAAANDILKLRKELIQARSTIADLQEELEEKTSLYLNAIKVSDHQNTRIERPIWI